MLNELFAIHNEVMISTPRDYTRYLYGQINWQNQATCILGDRGTGKTTMVCQHLMNQYDSPEQGLYISADNINVLSNGLLKTAQQFFSAGGELLCIDEVHKYPNWSIEIKNIIDTYQRKKIIFLGSSSIDLKKSKADLSRRVIYHTLPGLSFREYLILQYGITVPSCQLETLLTDHVSIASQFTGIPILKYFREYLAYGYYPFFLQGFSDYIAKVNNVIEKVIYEDIAVVYELKQSTLPVLKKILWLIATSEVLKPNIDRISKNMGVSREVIYSCFEYLNRAGLILNCFDDNRGMKLIRRPAKVYLNNTNLLYATNTDLKLATDSGAARETVFANQLSVKHRINLHDTADFIIDGNYIVEVGGRSKSNSQLKNTSQGFLALDNIEVGYKHKIPLFLFGLLY